MHLLIQYGIILSSLCFWFYIDSKKIYNKDKEIKIVNSALIHGIICGIGINLGYIYNPSIVYNYVVDPELYNAYTIVPLISFGYGFYDLYIGIKSWKTDALIHGILFTICNMYVYFNDNILLSYTFLVTETSSIFLNLRVFRKQWIDILFALSFFIYRIIFAPLVTYIYLSDSTNKSLTFGYISSISITILNLYWFYYIVKKALKPMKK
jgi:hypothetical protein